MLQLQPVNLDTLVGTLSVLTYLAAALVFASAYRLARCQACRREDITPEAFPDTFPDASPRPSGSRRACRSATTENVAENTTRTAIPAASNSDSGLAPSRRAAYRPTAIANR